MTEDEVNMVVERIGFEQILVDAELTVDFVAGLLHELGYLDLEMYEDNNE